MSLNLVLPWYFPDLPYSLRLLSKKLSRPWWEWVGKESLWFSLVFVPAAHLLFFWGAPVIFKTPRIVSPLGKAHNMALNLLLSSAFFLILNISLISSIWYSLIAIQRTLERKRRERKVVLGTRCTNKVGSDCPNCIMTRTIASGIPAKGFQANTTKDRLWEGLGQKNARECEQNTSERGNIFWKQQKVPWKQRHYKGTFRLFRDVVR